MRSKSIQRIPTELELEFTTKEEFEEIKTNSIFINFVLSEVDEAIEFAIENGKKEVILFDILNTSESLVLNLNQYSNVIDKLILINQEKENYEDCERLVKLKEKIQK